MDIGMYIVNQLVAEKIYDISCGTNHHQLQLMSKLD